MSKTIRLPGLIDIHVHFRDPGETYKEDFYTGSCAALAGGITAVFDMPNKSFHVLTSDELNSKIAIAGKKAVCDWGLYFGTDGKNIMEFEKVIEKVVGLKIYLNMTTGHTLLDDDLAENVFQNWPKNKTIVVHAEGSKIDLVIDLAAKLGNKIHLTHVNTKELLEKVLEAKNEKINITCDVTPHHLFLTQQDVIILKGFAVMKPSLASQEDVNYLWDHIAQIDCIATDHAPHTKEEKSADNPPTGVSGVETLLPLLLTSVKKGKLTIEDIIRLTNTNPQKIFGIKQDRESYVEVDTEEQYVIKNENLLTKCGWSPYDGWEVTGRVKKVSIRGTTVFSEGKVLVSPGFGRNVTQEFS